MSQHILPWWKRRPKILIHGLTDYRRDRKKWPWSLDARNTVFDRVFVKGMLVPVPFRMTRRIVNYMAFHRPCYKRPGEAPSFSLTSTRVSITVCLYFIIIIANQIQIHRCENKSRSRNNGDTKVLHFAITWNIFMYIYFLLTNTIIIGR